MNEFFTKIWDAIKKYVIGGIVGVIIAAVAVFAYIRARSRVNGDIQNIKRQLSEYRSLVESAEAFNTELAERLSGAKERSRELEEYNEQLRSEIKQSRDNFRIISDHYHRTTERLGRSTTDTDELNRIHTELERESAGIGDGIARLEHFLQKYGTEINSTKVGE